MSEKIEPALTAQEWADAREPDSSEGLAYEVTYLWGRSRPAGTIAIANAALKDDDRRKITRDKIIQLRSVAHFLEESDGRLAVAWPPDGNPWRKAAAELRTTADVLESYLPPETP